MSNIFYNILPMFLIALLGSVIRKKWLKSDEFWRSLEKLSFYILFPAVLFDYSATLNTNSSEFIRLTIALVIANLMISVALLVYKQKYHYDSVQFTSVFQGATRYNNYILFSVGSALFGEGGLAVIAAISPYLLILTNATAVLSFYYFLPKQNTLHAWRKIIIAVKAIFANPFIAASLSGFGYNYLGWQLNVGIHNTLDTIANSAFTIGMLIIGASMKIKVAPAFWRQILLTSGIKLIITPLLTCIIMWCMLISGTAKSVGILFSCLPCASSSYILSRQLGGDPETMSATITFSTLFSIISIPVLIYILG